MGQLCGHCLYTCWWFKVHVSSPIRRSSRPDVVSVTVDGDDACTHFVTVTALWRNPERETAFLLAENKDTGEVHRCDVIVDAIKEIGIETTTRKLYLEDSPEKFQIWARDSEGEYVLTLSQWEQYLLCCNQHLLALPSAIILSPPEYFFNIWTKPMLNGVELWLFWQQSLNSWSWSAYYAINTLSVSCFFLCRKKPLLIIVAYQWISVFIMWYLQDRLVTHSHIYR